jgi:hypothetical protein
MAQPDVTDAIREWLPTTPDGRCVDAYADDLAERLERLLRRVCGKVIRQRTLTIFGTDEGFTEAILQALRDEQKERDDGAD